MFDLMFANLINVFVTAIRVSIWVMRSISENLRKPKPVEWEMTEDTE